MGYKITIDGPSGTGKGFLTREISKALGILCIDTGAMYRAFALYCNKNNINIEDEVEIKKALQDDSLEFGVKNSELAIYINGIQITDEIRTEQVGMLASKVSAIPCVRQEMINRQRKLAGNNNIIMEGRDIGSVVFPDAELKVFLTAEASVRACRRYKDLSIKNSSITYEQVLEDIKRRDEKDLNKAISPLIKTYDMIEIDTTYLSKEQVVDKLMELIKQKGLI